ncbi:MAG TPA: hypothetical protein VK907_00770, partial [Phnomibacter sp.]|nr:hypothetical protein [Phnomibacter sp.]
TNSNVRNNAGVVKMWSAFKNEMVEVGTKAGMVMGDFSKTGINTTIHTGTIIGLGCSIHTTAIPEKHVLSFSWGPGAKYELEKLIAHINAWYTFKGYEADKRMEDLLGILYKSQFTP